MGNNKSKNFYNDLELICRAGKFEHFRDNVGIGQGVVGAGIGKGTDKNYDKEDYQAGSTTDSNMPDWAKGDEL